MTKTVLRVSPIRYIGAKVRPHATPWMPLYCADLVLAIKEKRKKENTDFKIATRAIASRVGPLLNQVVDATQTAFLPDRWIGDNVLAHLEEIAYLERAQLPGIMLFLDFEKAFDRLDRAWIDRCMSAVGFGPDFSVGCASCTPAPPPASP